MVFHLLFVVLCVISPVFLQNTSNYQLSVIHINDFHARFEQISKTLGPCKQEEECIGGFPRLYSAVKQLKNENHYSIFLNAGDNYLGTLWFNVFRWNVTQHFMNLLPIDAMVFGNHEFDDGIKGIVPFLNSISFPVLACNIDDSLEPEIQGLYKKSEVIERNGKMIGIIGVVYHLYPALTSSGKLKFLDEADSINLEAERLHKEHGVFTNIVVSHCGYDVDKVTASKLSNKISLIVGGHSHTLLYSGTPPSNEKPIGPYPTKVKSKENSTILLVQASAFTQYIGNISINYNNFSQIIDWEGSPIYLDNKIPQDESMLKELQPWQEKLAKYTQVYGETKVVLDITECYRQECNIGNFVADAMIEIWKDKKVNGTQATIALVNSGSIKSNIEIGNITYQDLLTVLPWNNSFDVITMKGSDIKKVLDFATRTHYYDLTSDNRFLLQVSGAKVVYNVTKPLGSRIISVDVICQDCEKPVYEPLKEEKYYKVVTTSYLLLGRDSFAIINENDKLKYFESGTIDVDSLIHYVKKHSPITANVEDRIIFKH